MAGITGNGATLYWGGTSGTAITRLTDLGGPEGECAVIECTTMDDAVATYLPGIPSAGSIPFDGNYTPSIYKTLYDAMIAKTTNTIAIVYSDSSKFSAATGFISKLAPGASLNGAVKASGTIQLSGAMSHTTS